MPAVDSFVGDGLAPSPYKEALAEIERLRAERDRYHDALIARHGGEPIALLSELDEARAERDALRALLVDVQNQRTDSPHFVRWYSRWCIRVDAALERLKPSESGIRTDTDSKEG